MKAIQYYLVVFFCLFYGIAFGQTASVSQGCIPLEVDFSSAGLSTYYWDFGDGASSTLQNPNHNFTSAGDYTVELFEGAGGTKIGELLIKVYADPVIQIARDVSGGCSPLTVQFTSDIALDNELSIEGYLWAFGDGNSSTLPNPTYTYYNSGDFDVSLEITTSVTECNQTLLIEDFVEVQGVFGNFLLPETSACGAPATFEITNTVQNSPGNSYTWDFGDGQTSTAYEPGSVTYNTEGIYDIVLTILNQEGCETSTIRSVSVGTPQIALNIPDSVCIKDYFRLENSTLTENFEWTFGGQILSTTIDSTTAKEPIIAYQEEGWKTLTFSTWNTEDCVSDTSFMIYVQDPNPTFTVDPFVGCDNPLTVTLDANDDSFATYHWTYYPHDSDSIRQEAGSTYTFDFLGPDRDTTYFNQPDSIPLFVEITTDLGCWDTISNYFFHRRPEAYFLPSTVRGCAPLTIDFQDKSQSHVPVVWWKWLYGTGDESESTTTGNTSFTYDEPGEYYIKLIIENQAGCIDTSYGVWLYVGEPITSEYTIDKTEVCLKESISLSFENMDPRIDAWHFDSDDGRFEDCWTDTEATHLFFDEPGTYPLIMEIEYNGCYSTIVEEDKITVKGAKADINYMLTCENPFDVMLSHESHNATNLTWNIANTDTSNEDDLVHTFEETGDYMIWLEVEDPASGCPADTDSVEVFIRTIEADFELPEKVCDNQAYTLSAAASTDVDADCYSGYLWILPSNRPREVGTVTIDSIGFPEAGFNEVSLVVTDINGCTDTITQSTISYGIEPDFESDLAEKICFPTEVNFQDSSIGDTTIVAWNWSFGATSETPTHTFMEDDLFMNTTDTVQIIFYVQDALGCIDSTGILLDVYTPVSQISVLPDTILCAGDTLSFFAEDYTEENSFLNFTWDFGSAGTYNEQNPVVVFNESGEYPLSFTYEEDASGCGATIDSINITVIDTPIADFATDVDTVDVLCHPTIISFTNTSESEGQVIYAWDFGNGNFSGEEDPVFPFDKGTYEVVFYIQSIYGCFSQTTESFTLVGPEGYFNVSDTSICLGETVSFELVDTSDIASYTWDFGDGVIADNQNPVSHTYDDFLEDGETGAVLILRSAETSCELVLPIPIGLAEVEADFSLIDSLSYCQGAAFFENLSTGGDSYTWDFGDGASSSEFAPNHVYSSLDNFTVSLEVSDSDSGCSDSYETTIALDEVLDLYKVPNVFSPNSDGRNDFFQVAIRPGFEDFISISNLKIYNRWGNLVYDNDRPTEGWDGRYKQELAPPEIYAYYIEVEIKDCKNEVKKGNITLIR